MMLPVCIDVPEDFDIFIVVGKVAIGRKLQKEKILGDANSHYCGYYGVNIVKCYREYG